jgi:hypothetical protein
MRSSSQISFDGLDKETSWALRSPRMRKPQLAARPANFKGLATRERTGARAHLRMSTGSAAASSATPESVSSPSTTPRKTAGLMPA